MSSSKNRSKSANYFKVREQQKPTTDYEASSRNGKDTRYFDSRNIEVITVTEVAELMQVSNWMVYELVRRNELPHFKAGRSVRFIRSEIIKWMLG